MGLCTRPGLDSVRLGLHCSFVCQVFSLIYQCQISAKPFLVLYNHFFLHAGCVLFNLGVFILKKIRFILSIFDCAFGGSYYEAAMGKWFGVCDDDNWSYRDFFSIKCII